MSMSDIVGSENYIDSKALEWDLNVHSGPHVPTSILNKVLVDMIEHYGEPINLSLLLVGDEKEYSDKKFKYYVESFCEKNSTVKGSDNLKTLKSLGRASDFIIWGKSGFFSGTDLILYKKFIEYVGKECQI